ncbi:serine/threonine-protein kinase [Pelagicoccus sp. SDUM812002]|uniref:serine/threonine protein kinase n=1 Tax=Pelagicoccus sp. SDUM812002 TaxID=3041266 RepID=UPI0028108650|nr:serine/threonine-protein kinase [Pelagicoccus sp. SDUM812002]MDQ8186539.1 serine/threonine-protein kinase [Pelagicoccus sp. SDUM812002]
MKLPSEKEEEVFCNALEIEAPLQREIYLSQTCTPEMRETVEAMLRDFEKANTVFDECSKSFTWTEEMEREAIDATSGDYYIGSTIGNYHITRFLGKGGSSFVYEAQQEVPVRRTVALKILRPGLDSHKVIDRFNAERQTLAIMQHPNIASVFDAGTTDRGHPFFVMERVEGTRITDFCNDNLDTLEDRIKLVISVCGAIQHAHQKRVIHLDLKPSNVLVSQIEESAVPKVIDFGIAQAFADQSDPQADRQSPQLAGTPQYMSPEQTAGRNLSDTRSDIFSLGTILKELTRDYLTAASPTRLSNIDAPRSDLNLIILKATAHNPEDRYHTALGLAKDLENFLQGRPVEAHPPSNLYRFRKLLGRNRLTSGALALATVAILGGLTTSTILLFRAQAAEQQELVLRLAAEERELVTKTANLIMQGKLSEADDEISKLAGPLTQTSVEASFVFWELGIWNGMRKGWNTASERFLALARVNRFDETDQSDKATQKYLPIGPTLIEAGKIDQYWKFHQDLIERKGHSDNPIAAEQLLKGGLLLPADKEWLSKLGSLAAVAEDSLAPNDFDPSDWLQAWRCAILGLWYYRNEDYETSIIWSDRAIGFQDEQFCRRYYCETIKAMAFHHLGYEKLAMSELDAARRTIEATLAGPLEYHMQGFWHDWVAAGILLREAQQLLSGAESPL